MPADNMKPGSAGIPFKFSDVRHTTVFRLTILLGLAFVLTVCALADLIYRLTAHELLARTDQVLRNEVQRLREVPEDRLPDAVRAAMADSTSGLNYFALYSADGKLLIGDMPINLAARRPSEQPFEPSQSTGAPTPIRLIVVRTGSDGKLVLGRDITQIDDLRRRVLEIIAFGAFAAVIVVLAIGTILSVGPLRRIRHVESIAGRIAQGDLSLRMPISRRRDELDSVATTVNAMIDEIERLMQQVKGTTDAIAHDLRSPLVHLRDRFQALLPPQETREQPEGFSEQIENAIEQLDMVLARFTALLRISELEASRRKAAFSALDPMTLVSRVCELYEPLAEERQIHLTLSGSFGFIVEGDERLLFEAFSNIVENAIKFIPPGGIIAASVNGDGSSALIEVRDNGPGIPAEERDSVLRRFHRGSAAKKVPGTGLGLSLVAAVLHLHGFTLEMEDAAPGLVVKIRCPRSEI